MLKKSRTYLLRFVLLVVAVQILNLSVYAGDFDQLHFINHKHSIGNFNEVDSLAEYITEIVLDYKNAFPENGAHNESNGHSIVFKHVSFKLITPSQPVLLTAYRESVLLPFQFNEQYRFLYFKEINPPPPKLS